MTAPRDDPADLAPALEQELRFRAANVASTTGRPLSALEVQGLALHVVRIAFHDSSYERSDPLRVAIADAAARLGPSSVLDLAAAIAERIGWEGEP